jgi:hypothetical protein
MRFRVGSTIWLDLGRRRLFAAELGNGTVDVVDLASAQVRASLFAPALDRLFVAQRASLLGSEAALLVFRPDP